jgi:hypothetical protein
MSLLSCKFSTKNLFSKSESGKGLMIKCWYKSNPSNYDVNVLDMVIKNLPEQLSYSVCEEREYLEVYIPSSLVKEYCFDLEKLINGDEFMGIVKKVKNLKPSIALTPNFFVQAHFKITSGIYTLRLKTLLS